jgi:hypothetical protein
MASFAPAALAVRRSFITRVTERLDKRGLIAFDRSSEDERAGTVDKTVGVSLELLGDLDRGGKPAGFHTDRYRELAVFPEDVRVPIATAARLWRPHGFDSVITEDFLERLFGLGLLQSLDLEKRTVSLHDVLRRYLIGSAGASALKAVHSEISMAYGSVTAPDMHDASTDEVQYYCRYLLYHLRLGGDWDQIVQCFPGLFGLVQPGAYGLNYPFEWHCTYTEVSKEYGGEFSDALRPEHLVQLGMPDRVDTGLAIASAFSIKSHNCRDVAFSFPQPWHETASKLRSNDPAKFAEYRDAFYNCANFAGLAANWALEVCNFSANDRRLLEFFDSNRRLIKLMEYFESLAACRFVWHGFPSFFQDFSSTISDKEHCCWLIHKRWKIRSTDLPPPGFITV